MRNFFLGILGIFLAFVMIKYRQKIIHFTGKWVWAEKYLGTGGSYSAVVLLAIVIFFVSLLVLTGNFDSFRIF